MKDDRFITKARELWEAIELSGKSSPTDWIYAISEALREESKTQLVSEEDLREIAEQYYQDRPEGFGSPIWDYSAGFIKAMAEELLAARELAKYRFCTCDMDEECNHCEAWNNYHTFRAKNGGRNDK